MTHDVKAVVAFMDDLDDAIQSHPQRAALLELAETIGGPVTVLQTLEDDVLTAWVDTGSIAGRLVIATFPLKPVNTSAPSRLGCNEPSLLSRG